MKVFEVHVVLFVEAENRDEATDKGVTFLDLITRFSKAATEAGEPRFAGLVGAGIEKIEEAAGV